jgi:hypothetical protein
LGKAPWERNIEKLPDDLLAEVIDIINGFIETEK